VVDFAADTLEEGSMEEALASAMLSAGIGGLAGGVVAVIVAAIQTALTLRAKIDESLRDARIEAYKPLWELTKRIPQWPRATDVTYDKLYNLSENLRDWYFDTGGLYLSRKAQKAYGYVQKEITNVVGQEKSSEDHIADGEYDAIRDRCSALRTELTKDLLSRKRAFLFGR
jgi:hypothetical protein